MARKSLLTLSADLLNEIDDESALSIDTMEDPGESFRASEYQQDKIHYISDLHLDNKLAKEYGFSPKQREIDTFITDVVSELSKTIADYEEDHVLIFNGDTADDFQLSKLFFTKVRSVFSEHRIIVTLGNHEFWGVGCTGHTVEEIVSEYRSFFDSLNILLLHNDLFIYSWKKNFILKEESILSATDEELEEIANQYRYFILGGTGFSGYDPTHNASRGYYREAVKTVDEDRAQSDRFRKVYEKVLKSFIKKRLFVVTHCPKSQWSPDDGLDCCVYISGHTHRNRISLMGDRAEFADNQVGYYGKNFTFKTVNPTYPRDIFSDLEDGKYLISGSKYVGFYAALGIDVNTDSRNKILMLKRSGYYCFLLQKPNGAYWLLAGGRKRNINHTPDELYESMVEYSRKMETIFSGYNSKLASLSSFVKSFGGSGRAHGCIVDIDFYNHLYLCPFSGKLTPYHAWDIIDKDVYPSIEQLLTAQSPQLLLPFREKMKDVAGKDISKALTQLSGKDVQHYEETDIYRISRIFLTFQYLASAHIIRMWVDRATEDALPALSQSLSFEDILPVEEPSPRKLIAVGEPAGVIDLTEKVTDRVSNEAAYLAEAFLPLAIDAMKRSKQWDPIAEEFGIKKRMAPQYILRNLYFSKSKTLNKTDIDYYLQYAKERGY